jgi:hypothetical protein
MRVIAMVCLILIGTFACSAQYLDSLGDVIRGKANIDLRYESRWSFVNNALYTINGVRIGTAFEKKLRLGLGVNWNKTKLFSTGESTDESGNIQTVNRYFQLGYFLMYADVVFHRTKRWQLSVPIQIGVGSTWYQSKPEYSLKNRQSKEFLLLYEPGISIQFKVTRWVGAGADVAYRFTIKNNQISEKLASPTYALKFLIWVDQLYFLVFPESELSKRFGPAAW